MRLLFLVLVFLSLSACTGMLLGDSGSYDAGKRDAAVVSSDTAITSKIVARLDDDPLLSPYGLKARTHKATVTLTGTVTNYSARDRAGRIARDVPGVVMVNNQIVVQN